jgi:hypothetical protein
LLRRTACVLSNRGGSSSSFLGSVLASLEEHTGAGSARVFCAKLCEHVRPEHAKFTRKGYARNEKGRARRELALDLPVLDTPAAEVDHRYVLEPPPHRGPR